jgi:hypothetical protein
LPSAVKVSPAAATLRKQIVKSLTDQGFDVRGGRLKAFQSADKDRVRALHATAVSHRVQDARPRLAKHENTLLRWLANGDQVDPEAIRPTLARVHRGSPEELLFRYAKLHWSIPVSAGYGRRLRFLVLDEANGKLMGLIGLGDPVMNLGARDRYIGWDQEQKSRRLKYVLDAFVLGAVPPYSLLLCGKLIAMLAASEQVRSAFRREYADAPSRISQSESDGRLAMLTTTSALGRSSVYNRLRYDGRLIFQSVGSTEGSGEFHFTNGLYRDIAAFARDNCTPTGKHAAWGSGFRNRREVVKKCLQALGISSEWVYHGIRREVFAVPLAANAREFLRGEHERLRYHKIDATDVCAYFKARWLVPRSHRDTRFRAWQRDQWRLW